MVPAVEVTVRVNGELVRLAGPTAQTTLLDALRARGLTGAKEGCAEGECGACMVALVSATPRGTEYRPVNSCLLFLPAAAGQDIYTVEGLALNGRLADAQQAMAAGGGSQCGYCTPGFVVSLFAEHYRPTRTGPCDPQALAGNLCRCTGYRPIADAARSLGPAPDDVFKARLAQPAPTLEAFRVDGFTRPATIDDAVALVAQDPAAMLTAGGTDVAVDSNLRQRRWDHIVSLDAIPELRQFSEDAASVRIGAALPLTDISAAWTDAPAAWAEFVELFASPPIRNRATLGGNLATASPIGDSAPLLMAMDARLHIAGAGGRRVVPIDGFFTGYRRTVLGRGEIITAIELPNPVSGRPERRPLRSDSRPGRLHMLRFYKVSKRRLDDISTVAAAIAVDIDPDGRVARSRFAFGGMAATPVRVTAAEDATLGREWNESAVERVQHIIGATMAPMTDHRGSREYRLQVCQSLVEKFWWESRS
jgi:xanthine dehydrogenase small subunit